MIDAALAKAVGAGAVVLVTAVGTMYSQFTPKDEFNRYTAAESANDNRKLILDTVALARAEEPGDYKDSLCRTIEQAIAELCAVAADDAICMDRDVYRERAGCG